MNKTWMQASNRFGNRYIEGVNEFISMARSHVDGLDRIKCSLSKRDQQWARNLQARVVSNKAGISWSKRRNNTSKGRNDTSKGTNINNKWTRDPIRGKLKRNTTPISRDTTFDNVSNGWSFVIFQVIHLIFLVMKYNFENLHYIYIWGNDLIKAHNIYYVV